MESAAQDVFEALTGLSADAGVPGLEIQALAQGATPCEVGKPGGTLYLVVEGELKATVPVEDELLDLGRLGPGAAFGVGSFLGRSGATSDATVEALTPTRVLALERRVFDETWRAAHQGPAARLVLGLARRLADRVHQANAIQIEWDAIEGDHDVTFGCPTPTEEVCRKKAGWLSRSGHTATGLADLPRQEQVEMMINAIRSLQPLGPELVQRLGRHLDVRRYADGQWIARQGERPDGLYLLLDGDVDVFVDEVSKERPVRRMQRGRLFGQLSFLLERRRSASGRAVGEADIGILGTAQVRTILERAERGSHNAVGLIEWLTAQVIADWASVQARMRQQFLDSRRA
jgi:CRP-like cAMP-binding protein